MQISEKWLRGPKISGAFEKRASAPGLAFCENDVLAVKSLHRFSGSMKDSKVSKGGCVRMLPTLSSKLNRKVKKPQTIKQKRKRRKYRLSPPPFFFSLKKSEEETTG